MKIKSLTSLGILSTKIFLLFCITLMPSVMAHAESLNKIPVHCGQSMDDEEEKKDVPEETCCDDSLSALSQDGQIVSPLTGNIDFEAVFLYREKEENMYDFEERIFTSNADSPPGKNLEFTYKLDVIFHC